MTSTTSAEQSPWLQERVAPQPAASGALRADVVVIGAGITGVTAALLLARAGRDVVVCEATQVGHGVTGLNTAKVSALQGAIYSELSKRHGAARAHAYGAASIAGVELVAELAQQYSPDCSLTRRPAATVAMTQEQMPMVAGELVAARAAGLPVHSVAEIDAPLPTLAAVQLDDQLVLHPVRYVRDLMAAAREAGARLYEGTRVHSVGLGAPHRIRTGQAEIVASHVVVATHYPILDRGLYFARLEPQRSYCVAARLRGANQRRWRSLPGRQPGRSPPSRGWRSWAAKATPPASAESGPSRSSVWPTTCGLGATSRTRCSAGRRRTRSAWTTCR